MVKENWFQTGTERVHYFTQIWPGDNAYQNPLFRVANEDHVSGCVGRKLYAFRTWESQHNVTLAQADKAWQGPVLQVQ